MRRVHRLMPSVEVVAHRGASAYRAEHTIAAYELALDQGADALELDVRATADGELVVVHDPTLQRTAGRACRVADTTLADLRGSCRRAPLTLGEVLAHFGTGTRYLVELKDPLPAWEDDVVAAVVRHGVAAQVTLQSFDLDALARLRRSPWCPPVAALLWRRPRPAALDALARFATGVGVWHRQVDAGLVAAAHARGMAVRAWTVNGTGAVERALAAGVDGLITDAPDVASAAVSRRAALPQAA